MMDSDHSQDDPEQPLPQPRPTPTANNLTPQNPFDLVAVTDASSVDERVIEGSSPVHSDWGTTDLPVDESPHYDYDDRYVDDDDRFDDEHEPFEDPYAETAYPDEAAYDDPYANTPYATDPTGNYVHDPYGELDFSGRVADHDLHDIDMSNPENLHGGEYELDSKDPKTGGWRSQLNFQRYDRAYVTFASFGFLACILVIVITVALGGGGNKPFPHHADGSYSPWGLRKDITKPTVFTPPPIALETICTQENVATQEGFDACVKLCDPAQCCRFDPRSSSNMSCQSNHIIDCHTYHHYCERPPKAAVIPFTPPPDNIRQVCTAEKMHTADGVTACARACQGGTCCNYPTTLLGLSCLRGNEAQCQTYHVYCENPPSEKGHIGYDPLEMSFPFAKPPSNINEMCSPERVATAQGFDECLEICRSGTCCRFDPKNEPDISCREEHPADCPIYDQFCGSHSVAVVPQEGGTGISGGNPDQETYVEKVCSDHSLATAEGFANCTEVCGQRECCWKEDAGKTCQVGTHCEPYAHCLAMEASDQLDVAIQVGVNVRCTDALIATVQGRKDCLLACSQATCCLGGVADCPQENDSFCNQYEACEKVSDQETIPPAPASLKQRCAKENVGSLLGLAECDWLCSHAKCCWKEDPRVPSCAKTNPLCADYQACSILELSGAIQETFAPVPTPPETLGELCRRDSDATACQAACSPAECCWKTGHCLHEQIDQCQNYAPCAVLLGDIPDAPSNLDAACTREIVSASTGTSACESICMDAACCWKTGACLGTHPTQCQGYVSCAVLYTAAELGTLPPIAAAPPLLAETCSPTNVSTADGEMLCADECKAAECCWKTGECINLHPDICKGYVPCALLLPGQDTSAASGDANTLVAAPSTLSDTCTAEKVATADGRSECSDACEAGACCWKSGKCLQTQASACQGYSPCSVLMDGTLSAAAPANLTEVCAMSAVATSAGSEACKALCAAADCCWKSGDCIGTQPYICEGYVPCNILMGSDTVAPDSTIPTAPSFLKDVCTPAKVAYVEGAILCQDGCKAGECCWKSGSCLGTQQSVCEGYSPCGVLTAGNGTDDNGIPLATIPKVPTYLNTVCSSEIAGDVVHGHLCKNACERADCCWNADSGTRCLDDPNCSDGYDICNNVNMAIIAQNLMPAPSTPAPQPGTTPAPQPASTPAPQSNSTGAVDQGYSEEMITDACINHDNSIINLCAKVCEPSGCCYDRNGDSGESCPEDFPCWKYSACSILRPEEDYVDVACSSSDLSDCVAACGGSTCCFTSDISKTCSATNPNIICSRYTACEKLYGV